MTAIATETGGTWPLLEPTAAQVDFRAMAAAQAKLCRFTGHTRCFYSVAQHCVHTADLVSFEAQPYALLHDAHEAFIGDISTPLKMALRKLGAGEAVDALAAIQDAAIFKAAGLRFPMPPAIADEVKHADLVMLATEKRDLLTPSDAWNGTPLPDPARFIIKPWSWDVAMDRYTEALAQHFPTLYLRSA